MKIQFDKTPENLDLLAKMGSRNSEESKASQEIFAAFLGDVVQKVIENVATSSLIYDTITYSESSRPSYPLDLYYDEGEGLVQTWSQSRAGGLPTSELSEVKELKFAPYTIGSAVSIQKSYARNLNLDVVSKAINRMASEVMEQQERNAWATIVKAAATATTNGSDHIITSGTESTFILDDMNRLMTLFDDLNVSFTGGTSVSSLTSLTDLFMSSLMMEAVRGFSYNPVNTQGSKGTTGTASSGVVALPDNIRENFFRTGRAVELFGVTLHKLIELGTSKKYNTLFGTFASNGIAHGGGNFATADDDLILGLDLSRGAFVRPVTTDSETGSEISINVDDQFYSREDKMGWWTQIEESRLCVDGRAITTLIV